MIIVPANSPASTGYNLTRSLRTRASATPWLNRTFSAGNQKTWTLSTWVKRGTLGSAQVLLSTGVLNTSDSTFANFGFNASDQLTFTAYTVAWRTTSQVFRDPSSWYHIVLAFDTTQATAANRVKLYVNGSQVTAFASSTDPTLNTDYAFNQAAAHYLGYPAYSFSYFDGYKAETYFINGQQLTPTSFGSTNSLTGVWQPAAYTGTYGTNGFYLPFTDNSALTTSSNVGLGKDFSGNTNYWVTNNISITAGVTYDSMTDVPTLTSATAANFPVMNQLDRANTGLVVSNANLTVTNTGGAGNANIRASFVIPTTGKWYWEVVNSGSANNFNTGISTTSIALNASTGYVFYNEGGNISNGTTTTGGFATIALNDVIGVAFDVSANLVYFYKNNTLVNSGGTTPTISAPLMPIFGLYTTNNAQTVNFGQQPFTYTPPTGFVALCTYNLPTSTIVKGNTVMDATLWTGNGGASQVITNAGAFKPDLVWMKTRNQAYGHLLFDSIRGTSLYLQSNGTGAEVTDTAMLSSFNSSGFTVGSSGFTNGSGNTEVGWQWQAGQGSTSSNTNGTITSTVSVNASAGFSIVTYTGNGTNGATVGHGLGVKPSLIIEKGRASAYNWVVQGCGVLWPTATQTLFLNSTSGLNAGSAIAAPTSSVFTPAALNYANESGLGYVAYCWTPIAGFSAFGSYTGNGSADGPMIYTGFRPKFVIIKRTDTTGDWYTFDSVRDPYNATQQGLSPNASASETTYTGWGDLLSNGFKIRRTDGAWNASGGTYIYMAFAESPFRNSLAR